MKQVVLDTDTLSYIIDQRYADVLSTARQYLRVFRHYSISSVTVAEILKGMRLTLNHAGAASFLRFIEGCEVLPFDVEEAVLAAAISAQLELGGQQIGPLDPFIAATAIQSDRPLVTNNTRHYQRIVDLGFPLVLENWRVS